MSCHKTFLVPVAVFVALTAIACTNRQEPTLSVSGLPGRYLLRGVPAKHDVLELKRDGTYTRMSGLAPGVMSAGTWIAEAGGKGMRVALSGFVVPIARGPVEFVPLVERVRGKIVIWVDQDTGLYYEKEYD